MEFIHAIEQVEVTVELKYCERCGGLFLRWQGELEMCCGGCRERLAAMPWARERWRWDRRLQREGHVELQAQIPCLLGMAEMEVQP